MSLRAAAGVARLARFHADGLAAFDASPTGLLNALAPWLAFALVGFIIMLLAGAAGQALAGLLTSVVALLAPSVLSQALARHWGREAAWLRYAVAFTWCQWAMPPALLAALLGGGVLMAGGLPEALAALFAALAVMGYALALHVFVAVHALALSRWRALALVLGVNIGTVALVALPDLVGMALREG